MFFIYLVQEIRGKTSGAVKNSIQGIQELGSSKMKATAKDRDSKVSTSYLSRPGVIPV